MLRPDTWRRVKKRNKTVIWIWMLVVVLALTGRVWGTDKDSLIHRSSRRCTERSKTTLNCDISKDKTTFYKLVDFNWGDITKTIIKGNNNYSHTLHIMEPPCTNHSKEREVIIQNMSRVTTAPLINNCSLQLSFENCRGIEIKSSADLIKMKSSEADMVILPRVDQFDLTDNSKVGKLSVLITGKKSTITDSEIGEMTRLEVRGFFTFQITNTVIDHVNGFIYNSPQDTVLENLTVNYVSSKGFRVHRGILTLTNSKLKTVDHEGIWVTNNAHLTIKNSEIRSAVLDLLIVDQGSTVTFENVTIGEYANISFTLSNLSVLVEPLALVIGPSMSPIAWATIGVVIGLLVGGGGATGLMFYVKQRLPTKKMETNELLPQEEESSLSSTNHNLPIPPPPSTNHTLSSPSPAHRPLPEIPKDIKEAEKFYEEYSDVLPCNLMLQSPQNEAAQRPPFALPRKNTTVVPLAKNSQPQAHSTAHLANPTGIKNIMSAKQDERDKLPPPPPPTVIEEVYDIPEEIALGPIPPPSTNKPKLPFSKKPIPPLPRSKPKN